MPMLLLPQHIDSRCPSPWPSVYERPAGVLNQQVFIKHLLCAQTSSVPVLHGFSLRRQEDLQRTTKTACSQQWRDMMKILRAIGVNGNISVMFSIIYSTWIFHFFLNLSFLQLEGSGLHHPAPTRRVWAESQLWFPWARTVLRCVLVCFEVTSR